MSTAASVSTSNTINMSAAQEEEFVDYEEDEETAQETKAEEKDTKK